MSELVSEAYSHVARRLNGHRQTEVKGRAAEIVFLQALRAIGHIENIGRYREFAGGKRKLPAKAEIPISYILSAVAACGRPVTSNSRANGSPSM